MSVSSDPSSFGIPKLNPEAQVFMPAKQDTSESGPAAPKTQKPLKKIEVGDVGCFLCDDGLWCPMCSSTEKKEGKSEDHPPSTPITKTTGLEERIFHRTPGHERDAKKKAVVQSAEQDEKHEGGSSGEFYYPCSIAAGRWQSKSWSDLRFRDVDAVGQHGGEAMAQRIDKWLAILDDSGV